MPLLECVDDFCTELFAMAAAPAEVAVVAAPPPAEFTLFAVDGCEPTVGLAALPARDQVALRPPPPPPRFIGGGDVSRSPCRNFK